jgi:hypothetical protein
MLHGQGLDHTLLLLAAARAACFQSSDSRVLQCTRRCSCPCSWNSHLRQAPASCVLIYLTVYLLPKKDAFIIHYSCWMLHSLLSYNNGSLLQHLGKSRVQRGSD